MLSNFANFASQLLHLDLAFLRVPVRTLGFAPTLAQPVLVPDAASNRSILTYIAGLTQLQKDLAVPADLSSACSIMDLQRNITDRMQRLNAYISAEYNRQYHNGMFAYTSHISVSYFLTSAAVVDRARTVYPAIRVSRRIRYQHSR